MVEIADIKDEESLRAWLDALPRDTQAEQEDLRRIAVRIAARSALRVMPVFWEWVIRVPAQHRKGDVTALPVLRCSLISLVSLEEDTREIMAARSARAAADAAAYAAADADVLFSPTRSTTFSSAASARSAADAAAYASARSAAYAAARSAAYATSFDALKSDLEGLDPGSDEMPPLWSGSNPVADEWDRVRTAVGGDPDWAFWLWWYQGLLDGTAPPPGDPMLVEIASLGIKDPEDSDIWQDPKRALPAIWRIWERHRLLQEARELRDRTALAARDQASMAHRAHNHPPELVEGQAEFLRALAGFEQAMDDIVDELSQPEPDATRLISLAQAVLSGLEAVARYCGKIGDRVLMTGAGTFGATYGTLLADKLIADGRLLDFATRLLSFAGGP